MNRAIIKLYQDLPATYGHVPCVLTGKRISSYAIDHLIPFSVWENKNLWNLLLSAVHTNVRKRDKIPAPELIERQRGSILEYWGMLLYEHQHKRFQKEIQIALLGNNTFDTWKQQCISQSQNSYNYLIETRGFEAWDVRT